MNDRHTVMTKNCGIHNERSIYINDCEIILFVAVKGQAFSSHTCSYLLFIDYFHFASGLFCDMMSRLSDKVKHLYARVHYVSP